MTDSNGFGREVGLVHRVIVTGRKVGADRDFWVRLSEDENVFRRVVKLVGVGEVHYEPTITPITFARNYGQTLVEAQDAIRLNGYVEQDFNGQNFPPEGRDDEREFVLVCFHRDIDDDGDPAKSELLRELDKLGLVPEGAMELCFVGTDERTRYLKRKFPIVARRQVWRNPDVGFVCPVLRGRHERGLYLNPVDYRWFDFDRFLASRK